MKQLSLIFDQEGGFLGDCLTLYVMFVKMENKKTNMWNIEIDN